MSVVEIRNGTLEADILHICLQKYPITNRYLAKALSQRLDKINLALLQLEKRGILKLEPLDDVWYIRLLTLSISFIGSNPTQKHSLKHKKAKKKTLMKKRNTYDGMMYQ